MWKQPSIYSRKCHGFPRARLPFLTHNMARPPKDICATDFRVSPRKNLRKNLRRHVMWQDRLRPCAVFTETSEGFAPYYLAGIRHDLSQTTGDTIQSLNNSSRRSAHTVFIFSPPQNGMPMWDAGRKR